MSMDATERTPDSTPTLEEALEAIRGPQPPLKARYADSSGNDDLDHHIDSHRTQLESIDVQIANLDRTIDLEQQKLRDTKASLDGSYTARKRLLHLRQAMVHFVQELEASQVAE